jgi:hypothetical protein
VSSPIQIGRGLIALHGFYAYIGVVRGGTTLSGVRRSRTILAGETQASVRSPDVSLGGKLSQHPGELPRRDWIVAVAVCALVAVGQLVFVDRVVLSVRFSDSTDQVPSI